MLGKEDLVSGFEQKGFPTMKSGMEYFPLYSRLFGVSTLRNAKEMFSDVKAAQLEGPASGS